MTDVVEPAGPTEPEPPSEEPAPDETHSGDTVSDAPATDGTEDRPGAFRRAVGFMFWRHLCFGGLIGALIFFIVSVSPSLLPRGALFQGILSGISITIGYGLGSAVSAIARKFDPPEPPPTSSAGAGGACSASVSSHCSSRSGTAISGTRRPAS